MKKVSLVVEQYYQNNLVFSDEYNKKTDGRLNKLIALKNKFNAHGFDIATNDIIRPDVADIVIYYDTIDDEIYKPTSKNMFLVLIESVLVKPQLYNVEMHNNFNKVFTWNDDIVTGDRYVKLNLSHKLPDSIEKNICSKDNLCVMVSTNRNSDYLNELYTERVNAIRWFEENYPEEFDLFGRGWNEYYIKASTPLRVFNKISAVRRLLNKLYGSYYPSYRGRINYKLEVIKKYKFSICYENIRNVPGYITEKIFDVFSAGCVPIYLGANNIGDYIPNNCYIDKRQYPTYDALYSYMSNMQDDEYMGYLCSIEKYLKSEQAHQFSDTNFANTIFDSVVNCL